MREHESLVPNPSRRRRRRFDDDADTRPRPDPCAPTRPTLEHASTAARGTRHRRPARGRPLVHMGRRRARPEPRPRWVITEHAAVDTELGVLKTGKEADVHLSSGRCRAPTAAPCWRPSATARAEHRMFHRDAGYLEGRRVRRSRETRAMANRTAFGRDLLSGQWASAEFAALAAALVRRRGGALSRAAGGHRAAAGVRRRVPTGRPHPGSPSCGRTRDELVDLWHQLVDGAARAGPARADPRRPVGLQPAGARRAAGADRPAAGRGRGRQPAGPASSWPATCGGSASGSPRADCRPRSGRPRRCSKSCASTLGMRSGRERHSSRSAPPDGLRPGARLDSITSARPTLARQRCASAVPIRAPREIRHAPGPVSMGSSRRISALLSVRRATSRRFVCHPRHLAVRRSRRARGPAVPAAAAPVPPAAARAGRTPTPLAARRRPPRCCGPCPTRACRRSPSSACPSPIVARARPAHGFTEPFPIQAATLPDALAGRDLLGRGQTGSGKTLAFGLAMLSRLAGGRARPRQPRGLVLVPDPRARPAGRRRAGRRSRRRSA